MDPRVVPCRLGRTKLLCVQKPHRIAELRSLDLETDGTLLNRAKYVKGKCHTDRPRVFRDTAADPPRLRPRRICPRSARPAWRFSAWRRSALDFQDEAHWAQSLTGIHRTSDQPRARTRRLTIDRPTPRAPVQRDGSLDQASFAFFAFIAGPTPPFLGCVCLPDQGLARTPRGLFIRPVYFWIIFDATQKASDSKLTG